LNFVVGAVFYVFHGRVSRIEGCGDAQLCMGVSPYATHAVVLQNNRLYPVFSRVLPRVC
jgi:hypothetical protein